MKRLSLNSGMTTVLVISVVAYVTYKYVSDSVMVAVETQLVFNVRDSTTVSVLVAGASVLVTVAFGNGNSERLGK